MGKKVNIILAGAKVTGCGTLLGIGKNGIIPWHNSDDMGWFKKTTIGNFVIMGRNTYDSIGKPLNHRINVVISSTFEGDRNLIVKDNTAIKWVNSLDEAIDFCKSFIDENKEVLTWLKSDAEIFIIGGGRVYNEAISRELVDNAYIDIMFEQPKENFDTFVDVEKIFSKDKYEKANEIKFHYEVDSTNNIDSRLFFIKKQEETFDSQYLALVDDILKNGQKKQTRAGETLSVFGRTLKVDLKKGLPMLTTKKMFAKGCIHELLWFIKGDTNIKYLVDNNVHIWDDDAYRYFRQITNNTEISKEDFIEAVKKEYIYNISEKGKDGVYIKFGDLGPVYGKQWTDWNGINQLHEIIHKLKVAPNDRRLLLSAWNVDEIDKMALPPCHYACQFYTRVIPTNERIKICKEIHKNDYDFLNEFESDIIEIRLTKGVSEEDIYLDAINVPKYYLSCMWNQRSVDVLLGLPFNFLSYAILTHMVAACANMVPDELIFNGGDTHIYTNQIENYVSNQQNRDPYKYKLPRLKLNIPAGNFNIEDFTYNDIEIIGYNSYPSVKYPLSVGL